MKITFNESIKTYLFPTLMWALVTALSLYAFHHYVDLKPEVDEHFFFSSDDPQFQADKDISKMFPLPEQVVISVRGDIYSEAYLNKIESITEKISSLEGVALVQSLTRGPESIQHALRSPIWKRIIISADKKASFLFVLLDDAVDQATLIADVETIKQEYQSEDFEVMISGPPYIVELIRRNLFRDLKVFGIAAFCFFGLTLLLIFHSVFILVGTLLACLNASALTLILSQVFHIKTGPLTANLATIVFVLTLTHMVFMIFNWRSIHANNPKRSCREAVRLTLWPSFWSMVTTLLGFSSLLFVQATPMQQFGIAGSIGTLAAFFMAYVIFPFFLHMEAKRLGPATVPVEKKKADYSFYEKVQGGLVLLLMVITAFASTGLAKINLDPSLFSYFKEGSELREGMEYIDRSGGSVPLKIVIAEKDDAILDFDKVYGRLWKLHQELEKDPAVGSILSLPVLITEGKRGLFGFILSPSWLLKRMSDPMFLTKDKRKTLFFFRMNEAGRSESRSNIVDRLKFVIKESGFVPHLVGGVYLLQGELSKLVTTSLLKGLILLLITFGVMGYVLSRSFQVTLAMFVSLCLIPLCILGTIGHLRFPLDIISAPAINVGIAMGVDSMIHMVVHVRRFSNQHSLLWKTWDKACWHLWKPILCSMLVLCTGFGVFGFSVFPPTQRFGFAIVFGALIAPLITLFVLPCLASIEIRKKAHK